MGSREAILHIIKNSSKYANNDLCKKKIQKLVYLIEQFASVDLGYTYEIYFYGPYSRTLDDDLRALSRDSLIRYSKSGRSYLVSVTPEGDDALESLVSQNGIHDRSDVCLERIDEILTQYANRAPFDLELLTTTVFIRNLLGSEASKELIAINVEKIKGRKFSQDKICAVIDELMPNA